MPTGKIQPEFTDSLAVVGKWLEANGRSVYGTRGGPLKPQQWGVTTENVSSVFVHLFNKPTDGIVFIPGKYKKASVLNGAAVKAKIEKEGMRILVADVPAGTQVIELYK
jgi:alpha-L-fucosidase